ncbi:MAG: ribosomal RNA small subunit methyltransferase A [Candidatus Melainabacteria bacterium]|nr:ribosomal RNA small subunit methyltransferase A [Candidatus Melainabacteria bacterium]
MKVFRPSDLHTFLNELGIHPKSSLSQNFLIDGNIIQKIVSTAGVGPGDNVVEIGPGPGALTQALLETGARVTAIEMDSIFAKALERLQTEDNRLHIINQDVLKFPLADYLQTLPSSCKIVANLPYHITTPILVLLLPLQRYVESLTIMVQKEFADRMIAKSGTREYSSFTIFLQFYSRVAGSFTVSPNCFYPRPKVHSTVVHCKLHPAPPVDAEAFFQLTRTAFGQRRKMLRASLKDLYDAKKIEDALATIGKSGTVRPEELSLEEFISVYEALSS